MASEDKILISVQGAVYETCYATLQRFPNTLLGRNARTQPTQQHPVMMQLRCRKEAFDAILFYYQSNGILSRPAFISVQEFVQECQNFELDRHVIDNLKKREGIFFKDPFQSGNFRWKLQREMWEVLENVKTSKCAQLYACLSWALIIASIVLGCVVTLPSIAAAKRENKLLSDFYFHAELGLNIIFLLEYLLRLFAAPNKKIFFCSGLNTIDLIAFLPFLIIAFVSPSEMFNIRVLGVLRAIRILRVIRLAIQNTTMATIAYILTNCVKEMLTMAMYIIFSSLFWASIAYYSETSVENTQFTSIPECTWWAIQTILPVGYGDVVPISVQGKLVGSAVAILAAFTMTVPLLALGGKLLHIYSEQFSVTVGPDLLRSDRHDSNVTLKNSPRKKGGLFRRWLRKHRQLHKKL